MDGSAFEPRTRAFLFLQGPPGPAFPRLAEALRAGSHPVHRINFNGGDFSTWPKGSVNFRSSLRGWPRFLEARLDAWRITDIVLFGDCRPLHREALAIARRRGLLAHVIEEGYLRPDWVTVELGGVNGNSALPRSADYYRIAASAAPECAERDHSVSALPERLAQTLSYYTASLALAPSFPLYRTHRPTPVLREAIGWVGRFLARGGAAVRTAAVTERLSHSPYFLFPLQLDSDYQIRAHSPFGGMAEALDGIAASFAAHAPADAVLAVKQHPLDNGLVDWRRRVRETAERHGLGERLLLCELGDVDALVRGALGVVTVNSTTGTLALNAGRPVMVLGQAIYDLPGLTHQGPLDAFWGAPAAPDRGLYTDFRNVLAHLCLVPGGLFGDEAIERMVAGAVPRLLDPPCNQIPVALDDEPRRAHG